MKDKQDKRAGWKTRSEKSRPYLRYVLVFLLTMLIAFTLFTASFTAAISGTLNEQRKRQLSGAAETLTDSFYDMELYPQTPLDTRYPMTLITIAERLTDAYTWIVSPRGEIVYASSIPDYLSNSLSYSVRTAYPVLRDAQIGQQVPDDGLAFSGNYLGLFPQGKLSWISVVRPIFDEAGNRIAYLHMHAGIDVFQDARVYLINGLSVTVIVSLVLALIVAWLFGRRMMRPLAQLTEAAEKVALGDLSVRVDSENRRYRVLDDESGEENELSRLFKTFNTMVEHLEHTNEEQRDFIASITHDLRTPLTSINGFVEGMLDGTIPDELYTKYLTIVHREAQRLTTLVREMNDMVLLDGKAERYEMQAFVLYPLIHETLDSLEGLLLERQLTVQTNFYEDWKQNIKVIGDREQLAKVFYNLISNAIKFTPEQGVIAITATTKRGSVEIAVEDSGPGISADELPYIFDRFYKGDKSRTGNRGSGLGLYICRVILQAHGQLIEAGRSEELGGARFTFSLPLSRD